MVHQGHDGPGVVLVPQEGSGGFRRAVIVEEIGFGGGIVGDAVGGLDAVGEARGNLEAAARQFDRAGCEVGQRQGAEAAVHFLDQAGGSGDAGGQAAFDGVGEAEAVEAFGRGGGGGGFTGVQGGQPVGLRIVVDQEGAAAEAGGLRLDQSQDKLRRYGGVDGGAAAFQDGGPGARCFRVGGHHHFLVGFDQGLLAGAGGDLRGQAVARLEGLCGRGDGYDRRHGQGCYKPARETHDAALQDAEYRSILTRPPVARLHP